MQQVHEEQRDQREAPRRGEEQLQREADALLEKHAWSFATRRASLALSALGLFIREGGFSPKSIIRTPMPGRQRSCGSSC